MTATGTLERPEIQNEELVRVVSFDTPPTALALVTDFMKLIAIRHNGGDVLQTKLTAAVEKMLRYVGYPDIVAYVFPRSKEAPSGIIIRGIQRAQSLTEMFNALAKIAIDEGIGMRTLDLGAAKLEEARIEANV
jgi:hypothetical protein